MTKNETPPGWLICPDCDGWGYTSTGQGDDIHDWDCQTCDGTGLVENEDYEESENTNVN